MKAAPLVVALAVAAGLVACRKTAPATPVAPHPAAAAPPPPPPPAFRAPSSAEVAAAKAAGFPVDFAGCQASAGGRAGVWTCAWKRTSAIAHDPGLRPCSPLVGHDPEEQWGINQCGLVFWDRTAKLPTDFEDCRKRFVEEPAVVRPKDQDICMVFVGLTDGPLFENCLRAPYSEYREGFCRYPLAGPSWSPRGKTPWLDEAEGPGSSHAGHSH